VTDQIIVQEWYNALVEDCKAIITEAVFNSRWALVEGYHTLGERIVKDENYQEYAKGNKSSVQGLARSFPHMRQGCPRISFHIPDENIR
jgi:hypothetical protein